MKEKHKKEKDQDKYTETKEEQSLENEMQDNESKAELKDKKPKSKHAADEWKQKYEEINDKYLRLYSDFDNYRKRTLKERLDLLKNATEELVIELLPVVDDFERALQAFEQHNVGDEAVKGTELIYNKLLRTLEQKGLKSMDSMGKEFDTDFHEAITNIPAPTPDLKGKVVDVVQKGYLLNDKIIRFAKVIVGS